MERYDVIVVGAGIAGSVLARLLAEKGVKVLLVEKDEYSGKTTACGGLFDRPYFDRYVDDPSIIEQEIKRNVFIMPWGEVTYECDQVTVKRRKFDRYLAERAQQSGAHLVTLTKAVDYRVKSPGAVEVTLNHRKTRETRTVQAKLVAFADGPHTLAKANPLFNYEPNRPYWAYAYAYEVEGIPIDPQEIKIYLDERIAPWGYGWIFPNRNDSNIGVGTIQAEIDRGIKVKEKLFYFIEEYEKTGPLLKDRKIVDKKGGFIPMWLIQHFADDSQVVLGDAGGMVSPLFGAGIDYAIEAAEAAAPVILEALAYNDFTRHRLQRYEANLEDRVLKDLRKQMLLAKIIIHSLRFGKRFPVKILAAIAFGAKYNRWNKIKILGYPFFGTPRSLQHETQFLSHK